MSETRHDPRPTNDVAPNPSKSDDGRSSLDRLTDFTRRILKVPPEEIRGRIERSKRTG
jgi:hypothetical protein